MNGQLFPGYVECAFLNAYRCDQCGCTGETLLVSFPTLVWKREDNTILISYPVRCPCGRTGVATTQLPFLLFCFICGWLEYQGTPRHRQPKSPQQVEANTSALLPHIIRDFEQVMDSYRIQSAVAAAVEPSKAGEQICHTGRSMDRPTAVDRALFGIGPEAWQAFLRRMGFSEGEQRGR